MKNSVCKIHKSNGINCTGFFCKVNYLNDHNFLPVLITNNHVLTEEDIENEKNILISINNEKFNRTIYIDDSRKKFTSSKFDITIIKIKIKEDDNDINNFLEIDETIYKNRLFVETALINKSIYMIHYPKGKDVKISYGLLSNISGNNISHLCCTEEGSSGAPIISLETNKVICLHVGHSKNNFQFNKGICFKYSINKFIYQNKLKEEVKNLKRIYISTKKFIYPNFKKVIFPLDVKEYDNIKKIIERIEKEISVDLSNYETEFYQLYLKYKHFYLGEYENISDYNKCINDTNIINESVLKFEYNRKPWLNDINIQMPNNKAYNIFGRYLDSISIKDLKGLIEEELGFPVNEQILVKKHKILEDNQILTLLNMYERENCFHLYLKDLQNGKIKIKCKDYDEITKNKEKNSKIGKENLKSSYSYIKIQDSYEKNENKNMINIFIENKIGETIILLNEPKTLIKEIKCQIKEKLILDLDSSFSPNQQNLSFNGTIMEDNKPLSYYNIKDESKISLKINMIIFIELLNGNFIMLKVQPNEAIGDIKIKIKNQEDIPINNQKYLYFYNKKIENDDLTLHQIGIPNYSILKFFEYKEKKEVIYVKVKYGGTFKVFIPNSSLPIQDLMSLIEEQEGIPYH